MKLAENGNDSFPCKEHGYTEYTRTDTHTVPGIVSVAVDFWYVPKNQSLWIMFDKKITQKKPFSFEKYNKKTK